MIQMLLAQPLEDADLSALVALSSGAAPLPDETRREFEARVPSATIYEGYGCTESASLISANPLGARRIGSVGLPVPGCEVTIQDDAGRPLPAGEDGEICVRSPGVLSAYWHAPEASDTALAGGWLHTGDIGHLDADGYLYVVDRKKDLIIRGGFNVFPRDVEDVLLTHPAVAQAGVVGRPDPRLGEEVVAFAALRPGGDRQPGGAHRARQGAPGGHQVPARVRIVPAVPLTSVGKLDRKRLRQLLARTAKDLGWGGPAGDLAEADAGAVGGGAVAVIATSSPSSRKHRTEPSGRVSGSAPPQLSSSRQPRCSRSGPLTVPEAKKSPVRVEAPFTVMWASIWAGVQYMVANGGRDTTWPLSWISSARSRPQCRRGRSGTAAARGSCGSMPVLACSSASSGTFYAEHARIGLAHIGEQFIDRPRVPHRRFGEPAIEAEGVIEIEVEREIDRFGKPVKRLRRLYFNVSVDRGLACQRRPHDQRVVLKPIS